MLVSQLSGIFMVIVHFFLSSLWYYDINMIVILNSLSCTPATCFAMKFATDVLVHGRGIRPRLFTCVLLCDIGNWNHVICNIS